jgi:hypothetical protein
VAALRRAVAAFGRFWWDFLVGDTPELTLGVVVVVGVTLLLRHQRDWAMGVVPILVAAMIAASVGRARRRRRPTAES